MGGYRESSRIIITMIAGDHYLFGNQIIFVKSKGLGKATCSRWVQLIFVTAMIPNPCMDRMVIHSIVRVCIGGSDVLLVIEVLQLSIDSKCDLPHQLPLARRDLQLQLTKISFHFLGGNAYLHG